jgi:hypothetical protein
MPGDSLLTVVFGFECLDLPSMVGVAVQSCIFLRDVIKATMIKSSPTPSGLIIP